MLGLPPLGSGAGSELNGASLWPSNLTGYGTFIYWNVRGAKSIAAYRPTSKKDLNVIFLEEEQSLRNVIHRHISLLLKNVEIAQRLVN